jgi:hypothetical protein
MNIAEQLQTIADNVPKVYQAGYDDGAAAGGGGGKNAALENCDSVRFCSLNWVGEKSVTFDLPNCTNLDRFWNTPTGTEGNTIVEHLTIENAKPTSMSSFISRDYDVRDTVLKRVTLNIDTSNVTNYAYAFTHLMALETIDGNPLDLSKATVVSGMFSSTNYEMVEVRFVPNSIKVSLSLSACSKLSDATIQSIVDGLADLSGQTKQTITFHKNLESRVTPDQKQAIFAKNWEQVY